MSKYRTIVAVVAADETDAIIRVLQRNPEVQFAGSMPGVTADALTAGAEPDDWTVDDVS